MGFQFQFPSSPGLQNTRLDVLQDAFFPLLPQISHQPAAASLQVKEPSYVFHLTLLGDVWGLEARPGIWSLKAPFAGLSFPWYAPLATKDRLLHISRVAQLWYH